MYKLSRQLYKKAKKILAEEKESYIPFIEYSCEYGNFEFTVFQKLNTVEIYQFFERNFIL